MKVEYFTTLEGLGKRRRVDIMDQSSRFLHEEREKLAEELQTVIGGTEKEVGDKLQKVEEGEREKCSADLVEWTS